MKYVSICACVLLLFAGAFSGLAQSMEKYDPRIDDNIALENKESEKNAQIVIYDPNIEDKILDKVWDLPEIKSRNAYLKSISKGKRYLGECIYRRPYDNIEYYWVKVGEDFGGIIVSHFNFYVDPKTMTIKYFNPETDTYMDLAAWRKSQNR